MFSPPKNGRIPTKWQIIDYMGGSDNIYNKS